MIIPHLTGPAHVGAAAGAAVRPGGGHDPHLAGKRFLAAVVQTGQRIRRGKVMSTGVSCQITLIGGLFRGHDLFPRSARHCSRWSPCRPQVETHVVTVVQRAQQAGEMCSPECCCVLVEPAGPVNGPPPLGCRSPQGRHRCGKITPLCFMDIRDLDCAQSAVVRRLSAPSG